jgi:hypothetical protein
MEERTGLGYRFDGSDGSRQIRMKDLRSIGSYILLAVALFVGYQGFQNSRPQADTEELSRSHACDLDSSCIVVGVKSHRRGSDESRPTSVRTDITQRRYEWETSLGSVVVTCKRAKIFLGSWSCTTEKGKLFQKATSSRKF